MGPYPVAQETYIWLADEYNGRILRINTLTNRINWWQLLDGSSPYGVAVESADRIWITDTGNIEIGLLVPSTGMYTSYPLPVGTQISLLSIDSGKVWYTEAYLPSFGVLDPAVAVGTEYETTTGWMDVDPTPCDTVSNPKNGDAGPTTGPADSAATAMEIIQDADGWTILQLPDNAFPMGIAAVNGLANVVDNGRQKLVQIEEAALQYPALALVKTASPETYDYGGRCYRLQLRTDQQR